MEEARKRPRWELDSSQRVCVAFMGFASSCQEEFEAVGGSTLILTLVNPAALLFHLVHMHAAFAAMVHSASAIGCNSLAFWSDETTVGNVLRPDAKNRWVAAYFTSCQWPEFFRWGRAVAAM